MVGAVNIELDPNILAVAGTSLLGLLVALLGALTWSVKSNVNLVKTLLRFNTEMQQASESRLKHDADHDIERARWEADRAKWDADRTQLSQRVNQQFEQLQVARQADEMHTKLLAQVKGDLLATCERLQRLETVVTEKDETIRRMDARIADLEKENQRLRSEAERTAAKVTRLETERNALEVERSLLKSQVQNLTENREVLQAQIETLRAKLDALEKRDTGALHAPEAAEASEDAAASTTTITAAEAADPIIQGESL